ncbi:MAG: cupin domain-containing protein [Pseudolabrys sp.]
MNVKPNAGDAITLDDLRSRVVRANDLPWEKMRFPGCEMKTLLFDPKSGMATALIKMAPGATLPDHEHVLIEQTYVLEGSLVDKDGPDAGLEVGPGEFVWRPAGSRHVAWCPNGGTMIAIFQVPNKFFEAGGRITDASGKNWDLAWKHVLSE